MQLDDEESTPAIMLFLGSFILVPPISSDKARLAGRLPSWSSDFLSSWNFGQVTDGQTDSNTYEPIVHTHRCAKKLINALLSGMQQ